MKTESKIVFIFDTSFFRSIYDAQGGRSLELVAKLIKNTPSQYSHIVPRTVLREYSKTRVLLQKLFTITNDDNVDISRLKKINEQLQRRAFERSEIGDFKIIAIALREARQGRSSIIVTNDEGFRIFIRNGLRDDDIAVSFTPDFLNFLTRNAVSKQDKAMLRQLAKKIEASQSQYRKKQGRGNVQRSVLEKLLSSTSIRTKEHPEVNRLRQSVQSFFSGLPIEEIEFPPSFALFRRVLRDFCIYLDIGKLRQAKTVLDQMVSRCKSSYDPSLFSDLDEIIHSILQYGYYGLAISVDKDGEWWEALGLLHSYQTLHVVRAQQPPREIQLTLTFANYIARGYSGLDHPILSHDQFLALLEQADLGLLHEIEGVATMARNHFLGDAISEIIQKKSGLSISNKLKRALDGKIFDRETPFEVKTPFDDVIAIRKVQVKDGSKGETAEICCLSIAGPICLRVPLTEAFLPTLEQLGPGVLAILQRAKIEAIRSPPVGVQEWTATFVLGEDPTIIVSQKRPLLQICNDLVELYQSFSKS